MNTMEKDKLEELELLREKVFQSEQERLDGAKTISISEARGNLRERIVVPKRQAFLDLEN